MKKYLIICSSMYADFNENGTHLCTNVVGNADTLDEIRTIVKNDIDKYIKDTINERYDVPDDRLIEMFKDAISINYNDEGLKDLEKENRKDFEFASVELYCAPYYENYTEKILYKIVVID